MIVGRGDQNFERVLNADQVIDKVTISVERTNNGMWKEDVVFKTLIGEIGN